MRLLKQHIRPCKEKKSPFFLSLILFVFALLLAPQTGHSQTILFQSGFESGDPAFSYSCGSCTGGLANGTTNPRTGLNAGFINGGATKSYDGSIITGTALTFSTGKYYQVDVYARVAVCTGSLDIRKSVTATNAAMLAAAGADIILDGTTNVTTTTYTLFSAQFTVASNETKYVGFQMNSGGGGPCGNLAQYIDDIVITEYSDPPCGFYCATGYATALTSFVSNVVFNTISRPSGWDGYICTGAQTSVQRTLSYNLAVTHHNQTTSQKFVAAWIDFNKDGDFADGGEQVIANTDVTTATPPIDATINQNITIPAGAALGTTKMRVAMVIGTSAQTIPCSPGTVLSDFEDYDININPAPTPMVYDSSTTTQANTASVNAGTFQNEVVGVRIYTSGSLSPLSVTSFTFNTAGTSSATNDILNAQLWSTSNNALFATTTQIGSTVANPNGSFTFTVSTQLLQGVNYFWLTYDVKSTATAPDVIDASCTSITVGTPKTPAVTAPAGNRPIITATPMVYVSSTTTQNVSRSPRPDTDHLILGVEIVTNGAGSPLSTTSFSFNTTGTSPTVTANIANAKLWSTGPSSTFAATTQIGSTVAAPNGVFTFSPSVTLISGTNYFWLTYDIQSSAGCDPTQADAQCTSITIGGTPRTPTVTSPLGAVVIDCNTPYYSKGSLPANIPANWNTKRDGTGTDATGFPAGAMFYLQNGHSMTTTAAATIPFLTIEAGGFMRASFLISCTDLRINGFGTFEQIVQATNGNYITNFFIENYGTWIHNNPGFLPSQNRYFSPRSNQWFYQWGGGTFPSGTAWGNVLLNGTTTGNFGMGSVLTTIQGDFEWRRIGSGNYLQDEQNETINIGGDLIFSGGWWKIAYDNSVPGNQTRTVTVNVAGDFIMTSGTLQDYSRGDAASGATLNINGDVKITGGTFNFNTSPGGASQINLTVGTPSVTWTQTGGTVSLSNTNVKSGKTATLVGNKMGDVAASRTLTVETGATLNCSNYPVTGSGLFTLATGATLGIGSAAGITSAGATGNIQVSGARSYNSGATYRYYEGLTPQITGNFTTTTTSGTYPSQVANLIMDKASPSNIVTLTNTTDVTGTLTLTNGILTSSFTPATAPWVRIPSAATVSPVGGSANSYVNGYIRRQGATSFIYPTGNGGRWRRIEMTAPSVSSEFEARYVLSPYANTTLMAPAPTVVLDHVSKIEHWYLSKPLGADAATVKVKLYWEDASLSGIYKFDSLTVARWSASGWEDANCYTGCPPNWTSSTTQRTYTGSATGTGAGTIQSNTASSFGPFTLASIGLLPLNPLPIELLDFSAHCGDLDVQLRWTTAAEINNDYFTLEKSKDGLEYFEIARIHGAGNSSTELHYSFTDKSPFDGINYYRLSQTDFDGHSETFSPISSNCSSKQKPSIYIYNNQQGQAVITIRDGEGASYEAILCDALGKIALRQTLNTREANTIFKLDITGLEAGIYFVRVTGNTRVSTQEFFVK